MEPKVGMENGLVAGGAVRKPAVPNGQMDGLPPNKVAGRFMEMFYDVMNQHTPFLYQFYRQESCLMVHEVADVGDSWAVSAHGQDDIRHVLDTLYEDVTVLVDAHSCQRSLNGSVMLTVTGRMRRQVSDEERLFNQAFLLARQPDGFYIHTDNIIVHGTATTAFFSSLRLKGVSKRGEEPEEKTSEHAVMLPRLSDEHPPEGKENTSSRSTCLEPNGKACNERQAFRQLRRKPGGDGRSLQELSSQQCHLNGPLQSDTVGKVCEPECEQTPSQVETDVREAGEEDQAERTIATTSRDGSTPNMREKKHARTPMGSEGRKEGRWQERKNGTYGSSGKTQGKDERNLKQKKSVQEQPGNNAGHPIQVPANRRPWTTKTREADRRGLSARRIFVAKLPLGVKKDDVEEAFASFGEIETVAVRAGEKTAFAFITYVTQSSADEALKQGDVRVDGKVAIAKRWIESQSRERGDPSTKQS